MESQILTTERLVLRPYSLSDVEPLVQLAGAREIAATTLRIPHPYTEQDARNFIATCQGNLDESRFAITLRHDGQFCGGVGLRIDMAHHHAELGYWLGVPFWGQGYATEAARAALDYGFDVLHLHRIHANHVAHNVASGRVLSKIGMRYEGCMRGHICKWDKFYDLECYGMLKSDRTQTADTRP